MNLKKAIAIFSFIFGSAVFARPVLLGSFDIPDATPELNHKELSLPLRSDGSKPVTGEVDLFGIGEENRKKFALISYRDRAPGAVNRTVVYVVADFTGREVVLSSPLNTGMVFQWEDNNYVYIKDAAMYFGVFEPKRMQFIYKDGVLSENTGPWAGPAKPQRYIEPEVSPDPCFNVNGVEECRAEQARDKAAKARAKKKSTAQVATPPVQK